MATTAPSDDLTLVIGAGAAGIAAARALHDAGKAVLLVEAADRLGGRARSVAVRDLPGAAAAPDWAAPLMDGRRVDLGCGWLHSATRNPWVEIAERTGFAVDRSQPHWREQWRNLGYPAAEQRSFAEAYQAWSNAAHAMLGGADHPLAAVPAEPRWRAMLEAISGFANGAQMDAVSLHDWAAYDDAAGEENWCLAAGYGTLVASHAEGVPCRLGTRVTRIEHRGRMLRIETESGTIEATRAIVCVAPSVLAAIAFDPPLPAKQDAAAALPLGLADKAFLAVDRIEWGEQAHLIGDPHASRTASHRLSPFGWPLIESFLGGDTAEALEEEGAACAFAIEELVALLGSDWRRRLHPLGASRWRHTPFVHGSYSHARVGAAGQRRVLAAPVDDRLFFAGEACHPVDFSTAHGAYATGIAAADAVLALRR